MSSDPTTGRTKSEIYTDYVSNKFNRPGGIKEAAAGLWHKTVPYYFGTRRVGLLEIFSLFLRVVCVLGVAALPILLFKLRDSRIGDEIERLSDASHFDVLFVVAQSVTLFPDGAVFFGTILFTQLPKFLKALKFRNDAKRREQDVEHTLHSQHGFLAAAIRDASFDVTSDPDRSLEHCLHGLKHEILSLLGANENQKLTDAVLLQYCNSGKSLQVRARTEPNADGRNHRQFPRELFLAHFVGLFGHCLAEHDFLDKRNPFPKKRITVTGDQPVGYRSVLYIPVLSAVASQYGQSVVDECLAVVCIHSKLPYRFWRWGDHRRTVTGKFATVAYGRSLPYIAMIAKLLEGSESRVPVLHSDKFVDNEGSSDGPSEKRSV